MDVDDNDDGDDDGGGGGGGSWRTDAKRKDRFLHNPSLTLSQFCALLKTVLFIHSFIYSFIYSFIHSFMFIIRTRQSRTIKQHTLKYVIK